MKHTKEPWKLDTVDTSIGICHQIGPFPSNGVYGETHACIYNDNVKLYDLGHSKVGDELHSNAKRIVSCVNSCAGIQNPAAIPDVVEALDTLTLVVGLTPIAGNKEALQEALDQARTALAKLEGGGICVTP